MALLVLGVCVGFLAAVALSAWVVRSTEVRFGRCDHCGRIRNPRTAPVRSDVLGPDGGRDGDDWRAAKVIRLDLVRDFHEVASAGWEW